MYTTITWILAIIAFIVLIYVKVLNRNPLQKAKIKATGNGQHGTARWSTHKEMEKAFQKVTYCPEKWRNGEDLPDVQGIIIHCEKPGEKNKTEERGSIAQIISSKLTNKASGGPLHCYIDDDDVHMLLIGASGIGKTAYFLYPNIEYAFPSGMSFFTTDTKGDLYRNTGTIGEKYYGYHIKVIDLRNPLKSSGYNMIYLVNKYMDLYKKTGKLAYLAKAEKYAKITAKTIIEMGMDVSSFGQNSYFYDSAEGVITATLLLLSEYGAKGERHIVSCFKLIQDMLSPSGQEGMNQFQVLIELLPKENRAKFYAASALKSAPETMSSVMSTAMSRLLTFIDAELEQIMCFKNSIDMEKVCTEKPQFTSYYRKKTRQNTLLQGFLYNKCTVKC